MDSDLADELRSRLGKLAKAALRDFEIQVRGIYSAEGHPDFIPEFRVREAVRAAEANARGLVSDGVSRSSIMSVEPQAYALICDAVAGHLSNLEAVIERGLGVPLHPSMLAVVAERFEAVRPVVSRLLENHRASFRGSKNKGGRPEEWDWAGAKAHVRAQFPNGIPKGRGAQTRIANMMAEWFIEKVGDEPHKSQLAKHAAAFIKDFQ